MSERRRHPRIEITRDDPLPCKVRLNASDDPMPGYTLDLSESGAAVLIEREHRVFAIPGLGAILDIDIPSIGACRFDCRVRHLHKTEDHAILGIEFVGTIPDSRFQDLLTCLKRFVLRLFGERKRMFGSEQVPRR